MDNFTGPKPSSASFFNIPEGVSYLNCAYMSPLSKEVLVSGEKALKQKATPYEVVANDFFEPVEKLKAAFAKLIDTPNSERVVVMPSASYGFATVAKNLSVQEGQNIVILDEQFPSNFYCWQRLSEERGLDLKVVEPDDILRGQQWTSKILESIDSRTAAVSMGIIHWTDGTLFDLRAIRDRTREVGAKLILDGTQAIGALPFSITSLEPDALICAAYKWLMGPYGISLSYFGPEFDQGIPIEESWINRIHSDDFQAQVGYQKEYRPFSTRYDMGEKSNFILVPMLTTALSQIQSWGMSNIQKFCKSISSSELQRLQSLGFKIEDSQYRAHHLFGIRPPLNYNYQLVKEALINEKVFVSFRGKAIRVSPHIYNSQEDIKKLSNCLVRGLS